MPRTQSTTPPLDPFPPLTRSGALLPSTSSAQTYAAIAARRAREAAGESRPLRTGVRGDGSATLPGHAAFWSVDDIDRQDNLDELTSNGAGPSAAGPSTVVDPSPPWRRRRLAGGTTQTYDPDETLPRSAFTGDPADDFIERDDDPDNEEHELDPVFSLDELLDREGANAARVRGIGSQTLRGSDVTARMRRMNPFNIADTGVPLWTTTSAPEGVSAARTTWDGGITAARRSGYGVDMDDATDIYGALVSNPADALNPAQTLRRRRRIMRRIADEDPARGGEIHAWNSMIDMPSDEDRWSRNTLYMQPNLTGDDVRLWNGSGLHRGGNNRRRASLRERIESGDSPVRLPRQRSAQEMHREASGMAPTNMMSSRVSTPLVVQSRTRKLREEKPSEDDYAQPSKKRRLNPDAPEFRPRSPPLSRPTYLSYTTLEPSMPLPDAFEPPHRTSHLALTTLHRPNRPPRPVITFTLHPMPTHSDADASALRANRAIPVACGIHYYEAEVLDQGEAGYMSVGWMMRGADLGRLVGWDPGSWGWHADDGRSFEGQGKGESFAEKWGTGDVVGCGVDFTNGRAFFTKNGKFMGYRFSKLSHGLHPAVGLRTPRESLAVNFTGPFMFDIDQYARDKRDEVWARALEHEVNEVPRLRFGPSQPLHNTNIDLATKVATFASPPRAIPAPSDATVGVPVLAPKGDAEGRAVAAWVLDYLQHHGYSASGHLLQRDLVRRHLAPALPDVNAVKRRNVPPEDLRLEDFEDRKSAIKHLESLASLAEPLPAGLLAELDPLSLLADTEGRDIRARMLVSSFVRRLGDLPTPPTDRRTTDAEEEEGDAALQEVVEHGQSLRSSATTEKWSVGNQELLAQAFGLLGTPPHLWSDTVRERWRKRARVSADDLSLYLRRINQLKARSYLETSLIQSRGIIRLIAGTGTPEAAFIDVSRIWEERSSKNGEAEGSRKRRRESEGEVEEVVEVKEEKAEVAAG